jgi:hypothetical protein
MLTLYAYCSSWSNPASHSFDPVDNLVEVSAGDTGKIYLQAKDSFGNHRRLGGDDVNAKSKDVMNPDVQYRGNVVDRGDGSYIISYSIPLAGDFTLFLLASVENRSSIVSVRMDSGGIRATMMEFESTTASEADPSIIR